MRILMLNNEFPPLGGGTGTVNHAILSRLARVVDLNIDLITSAQGTRAEREQFAERIRLFRVPIASRDIHHASNRDLTIYAARALWLALALQRERSYDFCFAWSALPAGAVALGLRRLINLRYNVRVCGPDIPGFERRYDRLYPLITPLIRATWRGAEAVIAKCAEEAAMIRAIDHNTSITLVPNGVDSAAFAPAASIPTDSALRILCVARLIERKGQQHLIEAIKRLRDERIDVRLELVGSGDARESNESLAQSLGVSERVHFAGYVPRERIAEHYAAAHVFALASYNEGMSVATLEAMAAGLPVVVTRTGGTADLVAEGVNGLTFAWGDVDALTAHLRRLATDRDLARQMGAASRARATHFSWDSAAERYVQMFRQMTTRPADVETPAAQPAGSH